MQWTTSFDIPEGETKINHQSSVFSIGSCFSSMISEKLSERKFQVLNNPFGTIFNPIALAQLMEDSILEMPINAEAMLVRDGLHLHYGMHSDVVAYSQDSLERLIHKKQQLTKQVLESATHIFLTFGTAWVYEHLGTGQVVANCHKQAAKNFEKKTASP